MKTRIMFICLLVLFTANLTQAQERNLRRRPLPQGKGSIEGIVLDNATNQPVEYANIAIYRMRDSSLVTGTVTNGDGFFYLKEVPYGGYNLEIDFIGYHKLVKNKVLVIPRAPKADLGEVILQRSNINLDEVEVVADKALVEYKIDRKVVNISHELNAAGGTAAEALENIPSVEVDIEGNVSLRGSSNFKVLIDGRPSILEGSDALQQIPASQVENIEIITNPSAKFDPDGTAGIINVIMKQKKLQGLTGLFNAGVGSNNKYKGDFLLNLKTPKFNIYGGMDWRDDTYNINRESERTYFGDTNTYYESTDDRKMKRSGISGKLGLDWYLGENTTLGFLARYGQYNFSMGGDGHNKEWAEPGDSAIYYISRSDATRPRDYYGINMNLHHKFDDKGQELQANLQWRDRWGDTEDETLEWYTNNTFSEINAPFNSIKTSENEKSKNLRVMLDYVLPFTESTRFETGYQSRIDNENEDYTFENYITDEGWVVNPKYTSNMDFKRNIHSAYALYQDMIMGIGYQLGLRGEYTDRSITDKGLDTTYSINRFDVFPTLHLSRQLSETSQLTLSYTRRINRPRGRDLDPFLTYMDQNNVRQGNPALEPEYTDSYELGWMKRWGMSFLSMEGYFRNKKNAFTRIFEPYEEGVIKHTTVNLNKEQTAGIEMMLNKSFGKKVNVVLNGTYYYYRIIGELESGSVNKESTSWRSGLTTTYKFLKTSRIQLRLMYRGNSVTAQGSRKGVLMTDLAIRHDFLDRKATLTLQVRDVFGSMKRDFTSEQEGVFYEHTVMQRESPLMNLTLTYRLNNYKQDRREMQESMENNNGSMEYEY